MLIDNEQFQSMQTVFHCVDPEQMYAAAEHSLLQLVMGQVIVSSKVLRENPGVDVLERVMPGQTVVVSQDDFFELGQAGQLELFLQEVSKRFQNVIEVAEEGRDELQVEYRLVHEDQDEVVAKCTHLVPVSDEAADLMTQYFVTEAEEAQLMRLVAHPQYVAQVKEEIFFVNEEDLTNYCCIYEKAHENLDTIPEIWKFKTKPDTEAYDPDKLAYYFF